MHWYQTDKGMVLIMIRLTHGGKVVSPKHRPHFTPQKLYYFYVPGTHFYQRLIKSQGLARPEGFGKLKKIT
jgi:hypothetical protein